jgi:peptidoglycan hydrolase CwlO-like protein
MAAGWLANLYPDFINFKYDESRPWADFVSGMKARVGDNVSVPPMTGLFQAMAAKVLDAMAEKSDLLKAQTAEISTLQARVEELVPFQGKSEEQDKKISQLEAKVKSQTGDIGALRKEMAPFQGKVPVDQQELENIIKDAITKNLRNFTGGVAAVGAAAVAGEAVAEAAAAEESSGGVPDSFGFGSSGSNNDGFGF